MAKGQDNSKREAVTDAIQSAFKGVTLGHGISLRQAEMIDDRTKDCVTSPEFHALLSGEVTNDWSRVPSIELERDNIAHLDARGFRYYIPALMLSVLERYESVSMRVIGTLSGLYPRKEHWNYHVGRYALLDETQKSAIAFFLSALSELVELDPEDEKMVQRAFERYWKQFLVR
jgi:hypothetical protein